jgi:hypothetical protein
MTHAGLTSLDGAWLCLGCFHRSALTGGRDVQHVRQSVLRDGTRVRLVPSHRFYRDVFHGVGVPCEKRCLQKYIILRLFSEYPTDLREARDDAHVVISTTMVAMVIGILDILRYPLCILLGVGCSYDDVPVVDINLVSIQLVMAAGVWYSDLYHEL